MERLHLRIEGIYDQRTFKFLRDLGVGHFSFDFRPRSFNFLPQYRFLELLQKGLGTSLDSGLVPFRTFLHYENEKDFVIAKMVGELEHVFPRLREVQNREGQSPFYLEFSDEQPVTFYQQFQLPFFWHYREGKLNRELLQNEFLRGIVLDHYFLDAAVKAGTFPSFIKTFTQLIHGRKGDRPLELFLAAGWDSYLMPIFFEGLDFFCLSMEINQSIEVCYRNVNLEKLKERVESFHLTLAGGPAQVP